MSGITDFTKRAFLEGNSRVTLVFHAALEMLFFHKSWACPVRMMIHLKSNMFKFLVTFSYSASTERGGEVLQEETDCQRLWIVTPTLRFLGVQTVSCLGTQRP